MIRFAVARLSRSPVMREGNPMRRYRKAGYVGWSRDQWFFCLPLLWNRAFGFFWNSVSRELVLILGGRIFERSQLGVPQSFVGGFHLTLSMDYPFLAPTGPVFSRRRLPPPSRRVDTETYRPVQAR